MINLLFKGATLFSLRASQSVFNFLILVLFTNILADAPLADLLLLLSLITVGARFAVFGLDVVLLKSYSSGAEPAAVFSSTLTGFLLLWCTLALALVFTPFDLLSPLAVLWLFLASLQVFQSSTLLALSRQGAGFLTGGALSSGLVLASLLACLALNIRIDLELFIAINIVVLAANLLVAQWLIFQSTGLPDRPKLALVKQLAPSTFIAAFTNLLLYTSSHIPLWFLVAFASDTAVVNYGVAFRFTVALGMVLEVSRALILPRFAQSLHQKTLPEAEPTIRQISTLAALVTAALSLLVLQFSDLIFGEIFNRAGQPVFWVAFWLLASQSLLAALGPGHMALRVGGQHTLAFGLSLGSTLALGAAMFALYPVNGPSGIAFAVFSTTLGFGLTHLALVKHHFNILTSFTLRPRHGA